MTRGFDEDEYRSLLVAYPPRPISEESELPEVEEHIWELLAIDERSPAQESYLTLLRDLVQRWEQEDAFVPPLTGGRANQATVDGPWVASQGSCSRVWKRVARFRCVVGQT